MLRLIIRDLQGERSFETDRGEVLVGRRGGIDLELLDPAVGPTHCLLRVDGTRLIVVDLGGAEGTFVGKKRVRRARLAPGASFQIGSTVIRVDACGGETAPAGQRAAPAVAALAAEPPAGIRAPVPGPPAPADFGREIRTMMRQAPWYMVSLVIHIVALLVLHSIAFRRVETTVMLPLEAGRGEESQEPDLGPEDPAIDIEDIAPEDELLEEMIRDIDEAPTPDEVPADDDRGIELTTPEIGLARGIPGPRKLARAFPKKLKVTGAADRLNRTNLQGEHKGAARVIEGQLGKGGIPRGIPKNRILVVEGEFDSMELVLSEYRIAYTMTTRHRLLQKKYPSARMLFINCGHPPPAAKRSKLVSIVKSFVSNGGWVLTTDWAIDPYLYLGWPDRVRKSRPNKHQSDTTVGIRPVRNSPILEGVFRRRVESRWWLEEASKFFRVVPGRTEILVASDEMMKVYGQSPVVFQFKSGRGRVVHLMGHFYQKDGNKEGLVGMHRLLINLIRMRFPDASDN